MQYSEFEKKLSCCAGKNIFLGFSGGADSCALFLILEYWRKKIPFKLTAVHFEHGLRGQDSLNDADFCREIARKYNVDFMLYHLNVPENMRKNETVESAARRLRLEKWREITSGLQNYEIHLAHHADDLAENVLLRIFRGANSSGISGLREFSVLNKMPVRRILLDCRRRDIENFLENENFKVFCTDKTNFDCSIGRNFLRNKVLNEIDSVFPYAVQGIVQSAKVCEDDADFIEKEAAFKFAEISDLEFVADKFWQTLHPALFVRVLRMYLSSKIGYEYIPGKNLIQRFMELRQKIAAEKMHRIELDADYFYTRQDGMWYLEKRNGEKLYPSEWYWMENPQIVFADWLYSAEIVDCMKKEDNIFYFSVEDLNYPLQISSRRNGEYFEKFGGGRVSLNDELTNHKIRGNERERTGILRNGDGEIMLVGNLRRSSTAPILRKNCKILQIRVEKFKK